jgi:hypothetical protein
LIVVSHRAESVEVSGSLPAGNPARDHEANDKQGVSPTDDRELDTYGLGQQRRHTVAYRRQAKKQGEERVASSSCEGRSEGHCCLLPAIVVEDLKVPADAFHTDVQSEDCFEGTREQDQWQNRDQRNRDKSRRDGDQGPGGEPGHEYTRSHITALPDCCPERFVFFEFALCHQIFRCTVRRTSRLTDI